jgi:short-subunit dehydrogenase involved in D-alanine esterification of teichoic acids
MSFPYKTVLVVGATSGIGLALAEKLLSNGSHVIAVERRQENLDTLVQKHGKDKVSTVQFDITDLKGIPSFATSFAPSQYSHKTKANQATRVTKAHPSLDSVILNSGIQRPYDFTKPESINLENIDLEVTTNYTSYIHLLTAFLPHLQAQSHSSLIFTTSGLALSPITRCPNYCVTKAALHHLIPLPSARNSLLPTQD